MLSLRDVANYCTWFIIWPYNVPRIVDHWILTWYLSICLFVDVDCLIPGLVGCHQLKRLEISGNAVTEEPLHRDAILETLPSLQQLDSELVTPNVIGHDPNVTPSSFEVMCRSQVEAQDAVLKRHEGELK